MFEELKALRHSRADDTTRFNTFFTLLQQLFKTSLFVHLQHQEGTIINHLETDSAIEQLAIESFTKTLENGYSYQKLRKRLSGFMQPILVTFRLDGLNHVVGMVVEYESEQQFNDLLIKTQLISDTFTTQVGYADELFSIVSTITSHKRFNLASHALVNLLVGKFNCSRVSLSLCQKRECKVKAISHVESFEKSADDVKALETLGFEAMVQNVEVITPTEDNRNVIDVEHLNYLEAHDFSFVATFVLRDDDQVLGSVTFEKNDGVLSGQQLVFLRLILNKITPYLHLLHEQDQPIRKQIAKRMEEHYLWWLRPQGSLLKLTIVLISLTLLFSLIFSKEYRVHATSTLTTDKKISLSAPFQGTIKEVYVKPGDLVKSDTTIFELETQELILKKAQAKSDILRYKKEADKFMAGRELSDMAISLAKMDQSKTELELITYKLSRAKVATAIAGIVTEGEKDKLLGAPVQKGDKIFEIMDVEDLYLEIKVEQTEIYHIQEGQMGEFILLSEPTRTYEFVVSKVIPKALSEGEEGTVYVVYGSLQGDVPSWWRPGMSGMVKINTGDKNIFWIYTHKFFNAIKIFFW
jgi:hypothetical protein